MEGEAFEARRAAWPAGLKTIASNQARAARACVPPRRRVDPVPRSRLDMSGALPRGPATGPAVTTWGRAGRHRRSRRSGGQLAG